MRLNVFEGARRIALAFGVLWVGGCVIYAVFSEPYVSLTYAVPSYGATPVPAEGCGPRDASKYTTAEAPDGRAVGVTLCFVADRSDNGIPLIPYRQVVSDANPEAARLYAARGEALRRGAHIDAAGLTERLLAMPVNQSEPRTVWMAGELDGEVRAYIDEVAAAFRSPPSGLERMEKVKRQKLWEQWKQTLQVLSGGLFVGWLLVAVVGWVVRGFLGIPHGRDERERRLS